MLAGRSRLAYGTWLRHSQRVTEARLELRSALAAFESAGVNPWSERARSELRAAGGTVTSPRSDADELTAQERQIAALAAAGLSNREIGARLYLSHRTVSTHLYHVFPSSGSPLALSCATWWPASSTTISSKPTSGPEQTE